MPQRAPEDHAIHTVEWSCGCTDCQVVQRWAQSPVGSALLLPMAEARRRHVLQVLEDSGAGFTANVLKQGSPHKLQLHKPQDLHVTDRARRAQLAAAQARLAPGEA